MHSLIARYFDSHDSCHSGIGVLNVASSQLELAPFPNQDMARKKFSQGTYIPPPHLHCWATNLQVRGVQVGNISGANQSLRANHANSNLGHQINI